MCTDGSGDRRANRGALAGIARPPRPMRVRKIVDLDQARCRSLPEDVRTKDRHRAPAALGSSAKAAGETLECLLDASCKLVRRPSGIRVHPGFGPSQVGRAAVGVHRDKTSAPDAHAARGRQRQICISHAGQRGVAAKPRDDVSGDVESHLLLKQPRRGARTERRRFSGGSVAAVPGIDDDAYHARQSKRRSCHDAGPLDPPRPADLRARDALAWASMPNRSVAEWAHRDVRRQSADSAPRWQDTQLLAP